MGTVYLATEQRDRGMGRRVALKVIRGGHFVDEAHIKMFEREAETLAKLQHPKHLADSKVNRMSSVVPPGAVPSSSQSLSKSFSEPLT